MKDIKKNLVMVQMQAHLKLYFKEVQELLIHLIHLKLKDYLNILDNINKLNTPKFSFDGNYLKEKGMKEGVLIGKTIKLIEKEWLDNDFEISNDRVLKIIKSATNQMY